VSRGIETVLEAIRPGDRVFVPGSSGEPTALLAAWAEDPALTRGLNIVTSLVPGINTLDLNRLHPTARVTGLFMQPAFEEAARSGRYRHLPLGYGGFTRMLADGELTFDVCVAQVAPPDSNGDCSTGPAVEFLALAARQASRRVGLVNTRTPSVSGAPAFAMAGFSATATVDTHLPRYETGTIDAASAAIAQHIAGLIPDGATLQVGLGKTPAALMAAICDRRALRLHSGMFGDGVMALAQNGALDPGFDHRACVFVGSQALYDWAAEQSCLRVAGCEVTHGAAILAGLDAFFAVNSAVEVDLFGQCALEHAAGRAISGAGGAPDFARAAIQSPGGRSIVALPATAASGARSRIVAKLGAPAVCTLPRTDVQTVVTEYGVADLRGLDVNERAAALIRVAAPVFQDGLIAAWSARS